MKIILGILVVIALLVIGLIIFVRTASTDIAAFSAAPTADASGNVETRTGFQAARLITTPPENVLRALNTLALDTARTTVVAGSPETGTVTWETRSRLIGFPDYTTATVDTSGDAPLLIVFGRLKFGQADLGVNKTRVQNWLTQLGPLTVPAS